MKKKKEAKKRKEFSKVLLIQESILMWVLSLAFLLLAFYCVHLGFAGSLPWLAAMASCPYAAYAVSQGFYYKKSEKENTKNGIKYETAMAELKQKTPKIEVETTENFNDYQI